MYYVMILISTLAYVSYNFEAMFYMNKVYKTFEKKIFTVTLIVLTIINILALNLLYLLSVPMNIRYLAIFILVFIEMDFVYTSKKRHALFFSSFYALTVIFMDLLVISILSKILSMSLHEFYKDKDLYSIKVFFTFSFCTILIKVFKKFFTPDDIKAVIYNKKQCLNMNLVMCFILSYLFFDAYMLGYDGSFSIQYLFIIAVLIVSFILFIATFCNSVKISKLSHFRDKLGHLERTYEENFENSNKLKDLAFKDNLTGCLTRDYAMDYIDKLMGNCNYPFCIIYIDLDNLKHINDTLGHIEGDDYIRIISSIIISEIKDMGVLSRIGGDEFLSIINGAREIDSLKILKKVECALNIAKETKCYDMAISYGVVEINETNTLSRDDMIKSADELMYKMKQQNKERKI
ncbi:MAG: GGDEF domain-containing protein [Oscillospiraceae bacterium]